MSLQWSKEDIDVELNRIERATRKEEQAIAQLNEYGIGFDKNGNARWHQEHANKIYPKPSEGPSTLIAAACLCGVALACFVAFVNWAIPLVRK